MAAGSALDSAAALPCHASPLAEPIPYGDEARGPPSTGLLEEVFAQTTAAEQEHLSSAAVWAAGLMEPSTEEVEGLPALTVDHLSASVILRRDVLPLGMGGAEEAPPGISAAVTAMAREKLTLRERLSGQRRRPFHSAPPERKRTVGRCQCAGEKKMSPRRVWNAVHDFWFGREDGRDGVDVSSVATTKPAAKAVEVEKAPTSQSASGPRQRISPRTAAEAGAAVAYSGSHSTTAARDELLIAAMPTAAVASPSAESAARRRKPAMLLPSPSPTPSPYALARTQPSPAVRHLSSPSPPPPPATTAVWPIPGLHAHSKHDFGQHHDAPRSLEKRAWTGLPTPPRSQETLLLRTAAAETAGAAQAARGSNATLPGIPTGIGSQETVPSRTEADVGAQAAPPREQVVDGKSRLGAVTPRSSPSSPPSAIPVSPCRYRRALPRSTSADAAVLSSRGQAAHPAQRVSWASDVVPTPAPQVPALPQRYRGTLASRMSAASLLVVSGGGGAARKEEAG